MRNLWDKISSFAQGNLNAIVGKREHEVPKPPPMPKLSSMPEMPQDNTRVAQHYQPKEIIMQKPKKPNPAEGFISKQPKNIQDTLNYWGLGREVQKRYSDKWWSLEDAYARGANISRYNDTIKKYAQQYEIDEHLLKGLIVTESRGNPKAVSPAGAKGLTQAMPGTAKEWGLADPFDPEQSIKFGARYLRYLIKYWQNKGYEEQAIAEDLAIASYNWGMGNVGKFLKGEREPNEESLNYLPQVKWHRRISREAGL